MPRHFRLTFSVFSICKYLRACALVLLAVSGLRGREQPIPDQGAVQAVTVNDYFAEIGRRAPGFGGIFVDESKDTIYVYMVNASPDSAALVDKALTDVLGSDRPPQHRLELLPGNYTFLQLKEWHDSTSMKVLAIPGAVQTGIDHWTNRLKIGVEDLSMAPQVKTVLVESGVPPEAVKIEEVPANNLEETSSDGVQLPSETLGSWGDETQGVSNDAVCMPACTLQSYIRPLVGGIQIRREARPGPNMPTPACTLGFIATIPETHGIGIVTASHCTKTQGGSEMTKFYQPDVNLLAGGTNQIALELTNGLTFLNRKGDPCYTNTVGGVGGRYPAGCTPPPPPLAKCPENRFCRRSDSSFSALETVYPPPGGDIKSLEGYIARPTAPPNPSPCFPVGEPPWFPGPPPPVPPNCSLNWVGAPAPDYFRIVAEDAVPMAGTVVNKVGRTTGWTQGTITDPCATINYRSENPDHQALTQLCQVVSGMPGMPGYMAFGGDSGSPVFVITNSPEQNDVKIVGLHFAGTCGVGTVNGVERTCCGIDAMGRCLMNPIIKADFSPIGFFAGAVLGGVQDMPYELGPLDKCAVVPGKPRC